MPRDVKKELHPAFSPEERRRLFRRGLDLFNSGSFYEAHEAWEDIWRSTTPEPKDLFQGLIQVAAALHQSLDLKRTAGPRRTFAKARRRLEPFAPVSHGLDITDLLESVGRWQRWLEHCTDDPPPAPVIRILDPAAVL
ncbi:MAG TPA: DUF309 domain-containing protein [Thermoanaerobaculia bacterium]|nr:DUF309 domain-containing protein [Thermoanaerobaculia bacterium]